MKCPRCGQETVNISNKHICTACGIVISESVPRDQILEQLRSKVASQNARNQAIHSVPSISNTAQRNIPNVSTETIERPSAPHETVAGKTLDQISREMLLKNNLPKQRTETSQVHNDPVEADPALIPDTEGEKVISRVEIAEEIPESQQVVQSQPTQVAETSQIVEPANIIAPAYANSVPSSTQAVYPSHQANPILIKILIVLVVVLILSIVGYVVYSNFSGTGKFTDNMIKYLGENVFK